MVMQKRSEAVILRNVGTRALCDRIAFYFESGKWVTERPQILGLRDCGASLRVTLCLSMLS